MVFAWHWHVLACLTLALRKHPKPQDDAQRDLDEALPALDQAVECLKKLRKAPEKRWKSKFAA